MTTAITEMSKIYTQKMYTKYGDICETKSVELITKINIYAKVF